MKLRESKIGYIQRNPHIIIKLLKTKYKAKVLKAARESVQFTHNGKNNLNDSGSLMSNYEGQKEVAQYSSSAEKKKELLI